MVFVPATCVMSETVGNLDTTDRVPGPITEVTSPN
jgi:hypothetical protein